MCIVTGNATKYNEMAEALSHFGITTTRVDADITEIKERDGSQVVAAKARAGYAIAQQPTLVDDSGIYFERYNQFPGTYSKFLYNSIGYDGIFKLVGEGDRAHFHCFTAYMDNTLTEPMVFDAVYPGHITTHMGEVNEEMPYAALFIPEQKKSPMGELTPEQRMVDHRHQALKKFAEWYNSNRP